MTTEFPAEHIEKNTISNSNGSLAALIYVSELAKDYATRARSKNTEKSYNSDCRDFAFWCYSKGLSSMPASPYTVACYLSDRAANSFVDLKGKNQSPLKVSSLSRRLSAISQAHQIAGVDFNRRHPTIQETWKGIKNTHGVSQKGKEPILIEDLRRMINSISNDEKRLVDFRDKAIFLLGFAGAFRRSEIVGINCEDLKLARDGVIITLNRSKTDQEGQGRSIAIPYGANPLTCPIRALQDWIHFSGIQQGPLFRKINRHGQLGKYALSAHSIALIIKRNAYLKENASSFSGHSLRAGFATTAALAGVPEFSIMRQTGHKRSDTLKKYIRSRDLWKDNPASRVGL